MRDFMGHNRPESVLGKEKPCAEETFARHRSVGIAGATADDGQLQATETQSATIRRRFAQQMSRRVTQGIQSLSRKYPQSSFTVARPESGRAWSPLIRTTAVDNARNRWRSMHHSRPATTKRQRLPKAANFQHPQAIPPSNSLATSSGLSNFRGFHRKDTNCGPAHLRQHFHCWIPHYIERETYICTGECPAIPADRQQKAKS
jgi:hypothetical protein